MLRKNRNRLNLKLMAPMKDMHSAIMSIAFWMAPLAPDRHAKDFTASYSVIESIARRLQPSFIKLADLEKAYDDIFNQLLDGKISIADIFKPGTSGYITDIENRLKKATAELASLLANLNNAQFSNAEIFWATSGHPASVSATSTSVADTALLALNAANNPFTTVMKEVVTPKAPLASEVTQAAFAMVRETVSVINTFKIVKVPVQLTIATGSATTTFSEILILIGVSADVASACSGVLKLLTPAIAAITAAQTFKQSAGLHDLLQYSRVAGQNCSCCKILNALIDRRDMAVSSKAASINPIAGTVTAPNLVVKAGRKVLGKISPLTANEKNQRKIDSSRYQIATALWLAAQPTGYKNETLSREFGKLHDTTNQSTMQKPEYKYGDHDNCWLARAIIAALLGGNVANGALKAAAAIMAAPDSGISEIRGKVGSRDLWERATTPLTRYQP